MVLLISMDDIILDEIISHNNSCRRSVRSYLSIGSVGNSLCNHTRVLPTSRVWLCRKFLHDSTPRAVCYHFITSHFWSPTTDCWSIYFLLRSLPFFVAILALWPLSDKHFPNLAWLIANRLLRASLAPCMHLCSQHSPRSPRIVFPVC